MSKRSFIDSTVFKTLVALLPAVPLAYLLFKKPSKPPQPFPTPDLDDLLTFSSPATPFPEAEEENTPFQIKFDPRRIWRLFSRAALLLTGAVLLAYGPWMVVQERWLFDPSARDSQYSIWCSVELLCHTMLPSYFWLVFVFFIAIFILFLALSPVYPSPLIVFHPSPDQTYASKTPRARRVIAMALKLVALAGAAVLLTLGVARQRIPGAELLLVILIFMLGLWFEQFSRPDWRTWMKAIPTWLLPVGLSQLALILFLQNANVHPESLWLSAILLMIALVYLYNQRREVNAIVWVMMLSLALTTWQINNWRFSVVGDDYAFFGYARDILQQPLPDVLKNIFSGQAVYGTHPYFSSLIQALSMRLLGVDSFGWRFSSLYLAAIGLVLFYFFFRKFTNNRLAMLTALLLGGSQYIMSFGKIGYNNLQAYFALALVLWAGAVAVSSRKPFQYALFGLTVGLCFYVYPAALYIPPVALLLLIFYDPPTSRAALTRWLTAAAAFTLTAIPVAVQPEYWQTKVAGTFLNRPEDVQQNGILGYHFITNFIYSLFTYVYLPEETHFIVGSYLDPLSAVFVPLGMAWLARLLRRDKFARFWLLTFILMLVVVGTTHDRLTPPNTRMFLLLPWFMSFAALGLNWVWEGLRRLSRWPWLAPAVLALVITAIFGLNLYQAYGLSRTRSLGTPSLEMEFLRLVERDAQMGHSGDQTYLFITDKSWGIDGLIELQRVYHAPDAEGQITRYVYAGEDNLPSEIQAQVQRKGTQVIVEPWMSTTMQSQLAILLHKLQKQDCAIQDAPLQRVVFTLYLSPDDMNFCPKGGRWEIHP